MIKELMNIMNLKRLSTTFLAGAAFLGAVINSQTQTITTSYTNSFDTADKVSSWHHWYDINAPNYTGLFSLPTHKKSTII